MVAVRYGGGGVAIPAVSALVTVSPGEGDDTVRIQNAIDEVSALPLSQGFRGAVQLEHGTYQVEGGLRIRASGVVLRGAGSGEDGTVVDLRDSEAHLFINLAGSGSWKPDGTVANIVDAYVPSGARSFQVDDASDFAVGDTVLVRRVLSQRWIDFIQPEQMIRNGSMPVTWLKEGRTEDADRIITSIDGNEVTIDAPITDTIDKEYVDAGGAQVMRYRFDTRIANVGVEGVRFVAPPSGASISAAKYRIVEFGAVLDGWARDIVGLDAVDAFIIRREAKRITIEDVSLSRSVGTEGSAGPADFGITGSQVLIQRVESNGSDQFSLVTHELVTGPNVALHFSGSGDGKAQPHRRWATGLLIDNGNFPSGTLELLHRGATGDGHGWAAAFSVLWNGKAKRLLVQDPPGAATNWEIGCTGEQQIRSYPGGNNSIPPVPSVPPGTFDAYGSQVGPSSLYLAQLCERLGPDAVRNIGY